MYMSALSYQERKNVWCLNPCVMYNFKRFCRSLYEIVLFSFTFRKFISEH